MSDGDDCEKSDENEERPGTNRKWLQYVKHLKRADSGHWIIEGWHICI